jgi:hypothetical protein
MQIIDNILNKDNTKLTFKERQLIIDYFRHLVNAEFKEFKTNILKKDKTEIFERAYLIDTYDNIRIRLLNLSFFTITKLLKYQKDGFIDYMYNADVNDSVFDYYDNIESEIIKEVSKLKQQYERKVA